MIRRWHKKRIVRAAGRCAILSCVVLAGLAIGTSRRSIAYCQAHFGLEVGAGGIAAWKTAFSNPSVGLRRSDVQKLIWRPVYHNNGGLMGLFVPIWILLIPMLVITTGAYVFGRTDDKGRCDVCNYDLQGSPSETCPECGTRKSGRSNSNLD